MPPKPRIIATIEFHKLVANIDTYLSRLTELHQIMTDTGQLTPTDKHVYQYAWKQSICYLGEAFTYLRDQPENSPFKTESMHVKSNNYGKSDGLIRDIIYLRNYFSHDYIYTKHVQPDVANRTFTEHVEYMCHNLEHIKTQFQLFKTDNQHLIGTSITRQPKPYQGDLQKKRAVLLPLTCLENADREIATLQTFFPDYSSNQPKRQVLSQPFKNRPHLVYAASNCLSNIYQFYRDYDKSFEHYPQYDPAYTEAQNNLSDAQITFIEDATKHRTNIIHQLSTTNFNKIKYTLHHMITCKHNIYQALLASSLEWDKPQSTSSAPNYLTTDTPMTSLPASMQQPIVYSSTPPPVSSSVSETLEEVSEKTLEKPDEERPLLRPPSPP